MPDTSGLGAIIGCRCPRCRNGKVFTHAALHLTKFDRMHKNCPTCNFYYEIEVGFFWGAMYISYGFSVLIVLLVGVSLFYLANDPPAWVYLVVVASIVLALTPVLFRYARMLMLYFFSGTKFDSSYSTRS